MVSIKKERRGGGETASERENEREHEKQTVPGTEGVKCVGKGEGCGERDYTSARAGGAGGASAAVALQYSIFTHWNIPSGI